MSEFIIIITIEFRIIEFIYSIILISIRHYHAEKMIDIIRFFPNKNIVYFRIFTHLTYL